MDLKHIIPQQRRRSAGPALDIQYSVDRTNEPRVGPTPVFTRASSGTFVNENGRIVGKTTSTTSLNPASVAVGGVAVFAVPSGSVVGWLNNSVVSVMVDSDGNDQVDAQAHVTGTLIHKTDTAITLLVTSKAGTATVSSWFVSYRGLRIDHDPVTGKCLGYIQENARTNLLLQSQNFGTTWTNDSARISISIDQTISPSEINDADKISENTTISERRICIQSLNFTSGTTYTFSCYVKAAEREIFQLGFGTNIGAQYQNFIVGGVNAGSLGGGSGTTASIQTLKNGWYRCIATITASATGSSQVTVGPNISSSALRWAPYAGTIGSGIFVWGAQLEAGTNVTSYIPTTATTAARAIDLCSAPSGTTYNSAEGTMFAQSKKDTVSSNGIIFRVFATDSVDFRYGNTINSSLVVATVNGVNQTSGAGFNIPITVGSFVKSALALQLNNYGFSVNGSSTVVDTTTDMPTITSFGVASNLFGHVSGVKYFRSRLPNAELQTLTSTVSETIVYNGVAIWYNGEGLIETS